MAAIERTAWAVEAPRKPTRSRPGRWRLVSIWATRAEALAHRGEGERVRITRQKYEVWKNNRRSL